MTLASDDIRLLTQNVWETTLGLELEPAPDDAEKPQSPVTGCVQITGEWKGAITIRCPMALARRLAAIFFSIEENDLTDRDVNDALGELANMVGGNLKALLPGPSQLSLPAVIAGFDYSLIVPGSRLLNQENFDCQGYPVQVAILERDPEAGRERKAA